MRAEAQRKGDAKVLAGAAAMATTLAAAAPALATVNEVGQVAGAEFLPSVLVSRLEQAGNPAVQRSIIACFRFSLFLFLTYVRSSE